MPKEAVPDAPKGTSDVIADPAKVLARHPAALDANETDSLPLGYGET